MRYHASLLLVLILLGLSGCDAQQRMGNSSTAPQTESGKSYDQAVTKQSSEIQTRPATAQNSAQVAVQSVSLNQADALKAASQAIERRIIRNAYLTVEVASPAESQRQVASIAELHQGFVVTSEATQRNPEDRTKSEITVNLVVRVPAAQFNQTMEEIRAVGTRVTQEKTTGQDVTEEFIDLEARLKNQKALEGQFLEIMKRAGKVEDALEVQSQLAGVRTEIEKLEGRKRFLENQASLSTINVTLQTPTQIVNSVGFWYSMRSAFADGVDVAAAIILFLVRAVVALLPVLVLVVFPIALLARLIVKRRMRTQGPVNGVEAAG